MLRSWSVLICIAASGCGPSTTRLAPATASTGSPTVINLAGKIAQAAATVTGQSAPLADAAQAGRHLGFDTDIYPGDATMKLWKNAPGSPYSWVGFYLPDAPCHADASWSGKRATLRAMGWGLAVVYVGQQTWGKTPRPLSPVAAAVLHHVTRCNASFVSAAQGSLDADDATRLAQHEGFPDSTVIFLDVERMETIPTAMRGYYEAWVSRMLANGRYRPGLYAHEHNAAVVDSDVATVYREAGIPDSARFWIAGGKDFEVGRAPQDVGFAFAGVWQGILNAARKVANVQLPIDVSVASWFSPSESGTSSH